MTDTTRFEGYGVLVTGAARGIGAAISRRLAEEGARVLVTDADLPEAEKTAAALRELGLAAEALGCDVGDQEAVERAVAHAVGTFGSLDVLVNCAAHCTPDVPLFEDEPDDEWARDLDITLTGTFRCPRTSPRPSRSSPRGTPPGSPGRRSPSTEDSRRSTPGSTSPFQSAGPRGSEASAASTRSVSASDVCQLLNAARSAGVPS
ncbi:SDR family NAD(P)-dependent oxidoreductase [Streptomyces sp. NBC_00989]|nr:SDR family NAD(P)-dependent oxidoreductase [Streptomyces sp. NBC_00989]